MAAAELVGATAGGSWLGQREMGDDVIFRTVAGSGAAGSEGRALVGASEADGELVTSRNNLWAATAAVVATMWPAVGGQRSGAAGSPAWDGWRRCLRSLVFIKCPGALAILND
ncbi:uncharacterized protein A4U43_C03F14990 [Asparagus officinalis]|uniref:Uncharacterized protein n=1 Tax=Asparagus officinalis TaxID=4686 RepID=A0A5P1FD03_ASPOF|nr:uncharacterized protein A4U43_C03F14990 [Asparagus officinalis]